VVTSVNHGSINENDSITKLDFKLSADRSSEDEKAGLLNTAG